MNYHILDALDRFKGSLDQMLSALYQNLHSYVIRNHAALY